MRLVDSRWSSSVSVVGSESSLINSLDRELSVPQIELIYLSEDRRARLYQLVSASNLTFSRLLTSVSSNPKRLFSGGPQRVTTDPMRLPTELLLLSLYRAWICDSLLGFFRTSFLLEDSDTSPHPKSILQISIFIDLREAFLGIEPHFDLLCHRFHL